MGRRRSPCLEGENKEAESPVGVNHQTREKNRCRCQIGFKIRPKCVVDARFDAEPLPAKWRSHGCPLLELRAARQSRRFYFMKLKSCAPSLFASVATKSYWRPQHPFLKPKMDKKVATDQGSAPLDVSAMTKSGWCLRIPFEAKK